MEILKRLPVGCRRKLHQSILQLWNAHLPKLTNIPTLYEPYKLSFSDQTHGTSSNSTLFLYGSFTCKWKYNQALKHYQVTECQPTRWMIETNEFRRWVTKRIVWYYLCSWKSHDDGGVSNKENLKNRIASYKLSQPSSSLVFPRANPWKLSYPSTSFLLKQSLNCFQLHHCPLLS